MTSTSRVFGGTVLIAAGIFQFTPLKHACLNHCRSPLSFLMTDWREGPRGAMLMGLRHGLSCTVCCWLLMLLLFVLGVMNLLAVAMLTLFVLVEKLAPWPKLIARVSGPLCIAWGVLMILGKLPRINNRPRFSKIREHLCSRFVNSNVDLQIRGPIPMANRCLRKTSHPILLRFPGGGAVSQSGVQITIAQLRSGLLPQRPGAGGESHQ